VAVDGVLRCVRCQAEYELLGEIPRMLVEAGMKDSARHQRQVYDARNKGVSERAQEVGFALQLIYRRDLLLETLKRLALPLPARESLWVYVGGGEGTQCMVLSALGGRHVSVDLSLSQLELGLWLRDHLAPAYIPGLEARSVTFVQADAETPLPLQPDQADVAYGLGVLNHLPVDRWADHVMQLARLVKPGGAVFQVVPNLECEVYRRPIFTRQFADPASMQYWTQFVSEARAVSAFSAAGLRGIRTKKLWHYDHDADGGLLRVPDMIVQRVADQVGLRCPLRIGPWLQRIGRALAERGNPLVRAATFREPRHLAIIGVRPSA
jgi:SAM-dependent methyltransferase